MYIFSDLMYILIYQTIGVLCLINRLKSKLPEEVIYMIDLGINAENFNPQILYIVKVENRDEIKNISYSHSHDFIEMSIVLSGNSTYEINGSLHRVKEGDILVFNPGMYHKEMLSQGEEVTELHIGFNHILLKGLPEDCILGEKATSILRLKKYQNEFFHTCSEVLREQEKHDPISEIMLKALVVKLISIVLRETYFKNYIREVNRLSFESSEKSNVVDTIISYMQENYMKDISLDKLSKNMYLSPVYISKIFKEETGDSPINYLINIRLKKANELLENSRLSIKAIAKSVGYNDAYYFSKLFKKYYGYPPSKIR